MRPPGSRRTARWVPAASREQRTGHARPVEPQEAAGTSPCPAPPHPARERRALQFRPRPVASLRGGLGGWAPVELYPAPAHPRDRAPRAVGAASPRQAPARARTLLLTRSREKSFCAALLCFSRMTGTGGSGVGGVAVLARSPRTRSNARRRRALARPSLRSSVGHICNFCI